MSQISIQWKQVGCPSAALGGLCAEAIDSDIGHCVRTCYHFDQRLVRIGAEHVVLIVACVEWQVAFWKVYSYDRNNLKVARHDKTCQGERPFQVRLSEECYAFLGDGMGSNSKQLSAEQTAAAVGKIKWHGSLLEPSMVKVFKQDFDAVLMLVQLSDLELTSVCA